MKRKDKSPNPGSAILSEPAVGLRVEIRTQVLSDVRRHARTSMDAEICGILIGSMTAGWTEVEASIQGDEARGGGTHVTFTHDTWTHIFEVKDAKFPDKRIVGWYHSHPGFGIFLSEHDTFIHGNFFSDRGQIAWVYDPQREEEGCFGWVDDRVERIGQIVLRDDAESVTGVEEIGSGVAVSEKNEPATPGAINRSRIRIANWTLIVCSHILVLVLGALAGALLFPVLIYVPESTARHQGPSVRREGAPPMTSGGGKQESSDGQRK